MDARAAVEAVSAEPSRINHQETGNRRQTCVWSRDCGTDPVTLCSRLRVSQLRASEGDLFPVIVVLATVWNASLSPSGCQSRVTSESSTDYDGQIGRKNDRRRKDDPNPQPCPLGRTTEVLGTSTPQTYRFPLPFLQSLTTLALPFPVRVHFRFPFSPFPFLDHARGFGGQRQ